MAMSGSGKTEVAIGSGHFRFAPEHGHELTAVQCPFSANRRIFGVSVYP